MILRKKSNCTEPLGLDEDESLMTSLVFDDVTSGWTCPFQIYNINSVIFFLIFFKNSGFIASNKRKSLNLGGYDVNKSERLCIGESGFNMAR